LKRILDSIGPGNIVELEEQTRELFARAVAAVRVGQGVADIHALDVSLAMSFITLIYCLELRESDQTLSIFLASIFAKKYAHPSSDIITILAGLDHIDIVFADFVGILDNILRNGRSRKFYLSAT
jgi:hypothetical protein